jgi:nucleoid DNA-binding protein
MNKKDLINKISKLLKTKQEAKEIVEKVIDEIKTAIKRNEHVTISNFGSFSLQIHKSKRVRHPKTGKIVTIPPRNIVKFKQSKNFFTS